MNFIQYMSVIQRNYYRYLDARLEKFRIGAGQQFFLTCIYEHDGITMFDLAKGGKFDKGTVTKGIQKLLEQDYISVAVDENDKRVRHLHITEKGIPLAREIYRIRREWREQLTTGLSEEESRRLTEQLREMAECSCRTLQTIAENKGECENGRKHTKECQS